MTMKTARALQAIVSVVVLAAAAGGIWLTYHVQHDKVVNLRNEVASLQTQVKTISKSQPTQTTPTTQPSFSYMSTKGVKVTLYTPASNAAVSSPVAVLGQVPGNWSFEAQFPIMLVDKTGKQVAKGTAQVLGDWMTDQPVPFSAQLTFTNAAAGTGNLVLQKDNPSGLAKNDDSVTIPVKF